MTLLFTLTSCSFFGITVVLDILISLVRSFHCRALSLLERRTRQLRMMQQQCSALRRRRLQERLNRDAYGTDTWSLDAERERHEVKSGRMSSCPAIFSHFHNFSVFVRNFAMTCSIPTIEVLASVQTGGNALFILAVKFLLRALLCRGPPRLVLKPG